MTDNDQHSIVSAETEQAIEKSQSLVPVESGMTPSLARRLVAATSQVKALSLDGENVFHHYRYPTIAQVRERANHALAENGVSIVPSIVRVARDERLSQQGKSIRITVVELELTIASDDGVCVALWVGESEDTGDKGVQKAVSAAMKSFLAHLLLMPVSEPETDEDTPMPQRVKNNKVTVRHWIDDTLARGRFWAWCHTELSLSDSEVHEALGIEHIRDFSGTMLDAKSAIEQYVAQRANADASPETSDEQQPV